MSIYPGAVVGTVEVDGEEVGYVDSVGSRDLAPPIVLVHGSGGTARTHFGTIFPMFASRRRVIAVEYGSTDPDPASGLTVATLAEKVAGVLEAVAPQTRVDLLGYSLGGAVAIRYAATRPSSVHTLTVAAGWLRTDAHQRLRNRLWHRLHAAGDESLALFSVLSAYGAPYLAKRTPTEMDALVERSKPGPDRLRQMQLNATLDVTDDALAVQAPTLIIGGDHDQMAPLRHSRELLGAIRDARLVQVRSGHAMFTERPAEIFQVVDEFVRRPAAHPAGATLPRLVI